MCNQQIGLINRTAYKFLLYKESDCITIKVFIFFILKIGDLAVNDYSKIYLQLSSIPSYGMICLNLSIFVLSCYTIWNYIDFNRNWFKFRLSFIFEWNIYICNWYLQYSFFRKRKCTFCLKKDVRHTFTSCFNCAKHVGTCI